MKLLLCHSIGQHNLKTVVRSNFRPKMAEKEAPPFLAGRSCQFFILSVSQTSIYSGFYWKLSGNALIKLEPPKNWSNRAPLHIFLSRHAQSTFAKRWRIENWERNVIKFMCRINQYCPHLILILIVWKYFLAFNVKSIIRKDDWIQNLFKYTEIQWQKTKCHFIALLPIKYTQKSVLTWGFNK